jgi:hypothetical protein
MATLLSEPAIDRWASPPSRSARAVRSDTIVSPIVSTSTASRGAASDIAHCLEEVVGADGEGFLGAAGGGVAE